MKPLLSGTLVCLTTLLTLSACGGGGGDGSNSGSNGNNGGGTTPPPEQNSGEYSLKLQVQGLPAGVTLPASYGDTSVSLDGKSGVTLPQANNYKLKLGKPVFSASQQNLLSCAFAEPFKGSLQADGSLQVLLSADATQAVQCSERQYSVLQYSRRSLNTGITGVEILTMNMDGSQAEWLPGKPSVYSPSNILTGSFTALLNNEILFSGRDKDINSPIGYEVYATDGTEAGTRLVKDIYPEANNQGSSPSSFIRFAGRLYFNAAGNGPLDSSQAWRSDGTDAGTERLLHESKELYIAEAIVVKDKLFLSDGTSVYLVDANHQVSKVKEFTDTWGLSNFSAWNEKLVFSNYNPENAQLELWSSDGTEAGTKNISRSVFLGGSQPVALGNKLYFGGNDINYASNFYISDGSENGTQVLTAAIAGINNLTLIGEKMLFTAADDAHGDELWVSDGTEQGTKLLKDINPGRGHSSPGNFKKIGEKVLFRTAEGQSSGRTEISYLWVSDGTEAGTHRLSGEGSEFFANAIPGKAIAVKSVSDTQAVFWIGRKENTTIADLWVTDGTQAGTRPVRDKNGNQVTVYQ